MSISRAKPATWGVGDKLTSAEINQVDTNTTYALDKRSGQTDTLASTVSLTGAITCASAGRIIETVTTGANADTSYQANGGNSVIRITSATTASRTYTLSATGAQTNDTITVFCESSFSSSFEVTIKDQASTTLFTIGNGDSADGQWAKFIYISGWRLLHAGQGSRTKTQAFTSSGSWVCPRGVTSAVVIGWGGGGGGGGGSPGNTTSGNASCGGSGGGGAQIVTQTVAVTPGTSYAVTIGAGGAGGGSGSNGSDGEDTTLAALFIARGGGGGTGTSGSVTTVSSSVTRGGPSISGVSTAEYRQRIGITNLSDNMLSGPGAGGIGRNSSTYGGSAGNASTNGFSGGSGGIYGAIAISGDYGGGGGGGGGGGPGAVGGNGGAGGAGTATIGVPGTNGTAGQSAAANSGAGGGGGGGGGQGAFGTSSGGAGGNGGSGKLTIMWVK